MIKFLILSLIFGGLKAENGNPCPPPFEILPCSCTKVSQDTILTCNYHDEKLIEVAFERFSQDRLTADSISINSSRLPSIPGQFFKRMTVKKASIDAMRMKTMDHTAFEGQEDSLYSFEIRRSQLAEVPYALRKLRKLEKLAIHKSEITALRVFEFCSFASRYGLREISLRCNHIKYVGGYAFSQVVNLEYLDLSYNKIKSLAFKTLPRFQNHMKGFAIA